MTAIRDLLGETLAVSETFRLRLEAHDGTLVADLPVDASPMDIAIVTGLDRSRNGRRPEPATPRVRGVIGSTPDCCFGGVSVSILV